MHMCGCIGNPRPRQCQLMLRYAPPHHVCKTFLTHPVHVWLQTHVKPMCPSLHQQMAMCMSAYHSHSIWVKRHALVTDMLHA